MLAKLSADEPRENVLFTDGKISLLKRPTKLIPSVI